MSNIKDRMIHRKDKLIRGIGGLNIQLNTIDKILGLPYEERVALSVLANEVKLANLKFYKKFETLIDQIDTYYVMPKNDLPM